MRPRGPRVVVLGMLTKIPVPGVAWQLIHYLLGLHRLGVDVYYAEIHGRNPASFMRGNDDGAVAAAGYIASTLAGSGLSERWAYRALHSDGACYGLSQQRLAEVLDSADLLINLHGGTRIVPEIRRSERLVLLETDPVRLQVELNRGQPRATEFVKAHSGLFTFAEALGRDGCGLPALARYRFKPTRQPVVIELWNEPAECRDGAFTTVGSFRQPGKDITFRGDTYRWSKHHELMKVIELPARTTASFELALSGVDDGDRDLLTRAGWKVRDAGAFGLGTEPYRSYIKGSKAEFTVAKDQNVRLRTGWFSDRSATYLASGKPVVTQDTGFAGILPAGRGLLAFNGLAGAQEAVEEVERNYEAHSRAARAIARECFDSGRVLGTLLDEVGLGPVRDKRPGRPWLAPLPTDLDLVPVSRWPTRLPEDTVRRVTTRPLPGLMLRPVEDPRVSVIVVTHEDLACSRLALETMLLHTRRDDVEFVVVDNSSPGPLKEYLRRLERRVTAVQLLDNQSNPGFAASVNQGLRAARGHRLVVCNHDIMVPPGWLAPLCRHLRTPGVGMVGPSTNRAANEAQIETDYSTYGGFIDLASRLRSSLAPPVEVDTLLMFCVALERGVLDRVGLLDEGFGQALFEDDDFSHRVRSAGYRLLCARDSFVHHFGQVSVGALTRDGRYQELFARNRGRFESKWSTRWEGHERLPGPRYGRTLRDVRTTLSGLLPGGARVAIASRGDDRMLGLGPWDAVHFPSDGDGAYCGYHPADTGEMVARIEALKEQGVSHLVIPPSMAWWLERYEGLASYLESHHESLSPPDQACRVWALDGAAHG